jgi:hypothetical protein
MALANPVDGVAAQIGARKGLARTNYFAITFNGPASLSGSNAPDPVTINALCESVSLPGRSISTFEHGTTRQATKRPYSFINDDVELTFYVTNDFYIKNVWDQWLRSVVDDTTGKVQYKKDYAHDVVISVLDLNANTVYQTTLQNAFPITIGAIPLSNSSENELMKLTVTLTYDNFTTKANNFEFVTSIADFNNTLQIPGLGFTTIPLNPFGDIPLQLQVTTLNDLKAAMKGTLDAQLDSIVNNIKGGIRETITSVTRPITNATNSVMNTIYGGFNQVVGTIAGGINGVINNITGSVTGAISGAINQPIAQITGSINSGISSVANRISSGIRGLFG